MKIFKQLGILCLSIAILVGCSKKDEGEVSRPKKGLQLFCQFD